MNLPASPPDVRFLVDDPRVVDNAVARMVGVESSQLGPLSELPHAARKRVLRVSEAWLPVDLDEHWCVAYRLAVQAGAVVVSEVRVYPRETEAEVDRVLDPGTWRAACLGWAATVPLGGITARLLRRVHVGAHHRVADAVLRQVAGDADPLLRGVATRSGLNTLTEPRQRTGRPRRPLLHYARVAERYVDAIARGSRRPAKDVADAMGVSRGLVRQWLHAARARGLLTRAPGTERRGQQGQKGGVLTPPARALLIGSGPTKERVKTPARRRTRKPKAITRRRKR